VREAKLSIFDFKGAKDQLKDKVRLFFTDNEERGRKGVKSISNMVPEMVLSFDCVGVEIPLS